MEWFVFGRIFSRSEFAIFLADEIIRVAKGVVYEQGDSAMIY